MTNKDGEKISSPDHEFLRDLLKFHYNHEEKSKDLDYFTTGAHSAHSYSRCFYIVKNDEKQTKTVFLYIYLNIKIIVSSNFLNS